MARTVRCATAGCGRAGISTEVPDVPVVRGVVSRPDLFCADCGQALEDTVPPKPGKRHPAPRKAVRNPPETR